MVWAVVAVVVVLAGVVYFGNVPPSDGAGSIRGAIDESPSHSREGDGSRMVEERELGRGEEMDGYSGDDEYEGETWAQCRERCNNTYPTGSLGRTNGRWDTCHSVCNRVHSPNGDLGGNKGSGSDEMETE